MLAGLRDELWRFLLAMQFLTRLPAAPARAYSPQRFAESVRYYPLAGLVIGLLAALIFIASLQLWPQLIAVIIATALIVLLTGAFHEDGLADTFDGIGGGQTPARVLEIMKDSRIGAFGMVALSLVMAVKIAALAIMPPAIAAASLVVAHCMSRWSAVAAISSSRYVRDAGTGKPTADGISPPAFAFASLVGLTPLLWLGYAYDGSLALGAVSGLVLAHVATRWFYQRRIGGYTGDCLGALQQTSEVGIYLGILACL